MSGPVVFAYGGGVNSKACAAELVRLGERVDLFIFSDPGGEDPDTYTDLEAFDAWLQAHGYPAIERVRYTTKDGQPLTLEADVRARHTLPAIAFGWKSCSERFKTRPQQKFVRSWPPAVKAWAAKESVTKIVGYHAGESHRAEKATPAKGYQLRYPLIEWGWDNVRCADELRAAGLAVPPKSSCFFCPSKKKPEILDLKRRHLQLYERALKMEDDARAHGIEMAGLGRRFSWRDVEGHVPESQPAFPCECFDGGGDDDAEAA